VVCAALRGAAGLRTMKLAHWAVLLSAGLASLALGQQKEPMAAYAASTAPTQVAFQTSTGSTWYSGGTASGMTERVTFQELLNSPVSGRALVTLCDDHSVWLTRWTSSSFWSAPTQLATNAGLPSAKVFAGAYETETGNLIVVYRKTTSTTLYYRVVGATVGPEQSFAIGLASAPTYMEMYPQPRGNEIMLLVAASGRLHAAVWSGSAWTGSVQLEAALPTSGRPFAGAYTNSSTQGMAVWSDTAGSVRSRLWTGATASWSAATTLPAVSGSAPLHWVTLAGSRKHASDEVLFAGIGTNNDISVNRWSGSSWGSNSVVETNVGFADGRRVALAYQHDGEEALLAWQQAGNNAVQFRRWWGGVWSGTSATSSLGSEPQNIRLEPGYAGNQMVMSVRRKGAASYADYMAYSANGSVNLTGTVVGAVGSGGSVALPVPPTATAGTTNISTPNNQTTTMTPGNYGSLVVGNACTLNFSAGTYVYTSFTAQYNGTIMNFNTAAGPVRFILTNGSFAGKNAITINNTGQHDVEFHILNGNFEAQNHYAVSNAAVFAYNGNIDFENNANFTGTLYASGNITGSGTIKLPDSDPVGGPGRLTTVTFTAGVPSAPVDLNTSIAGEWRWDVCALSRYPAVRSVKVGRWREIGPDE